MTTRRRKVRERVRCNKLNRRIDVPALRAIYPAQELEDGTSIWFASVGEVAFYGEKKGRRIARRRRLWKPRPKRAPFWFALPSDLERLERIKSRRKRKGFGRKRSAKDKRTEHRRWQRAAAIRRAFVKAMWRAVSSPSRKWFTLEP